MVLQIVQVCRPTIADTVYLRLHRPLLYSLLVGVSSCNPRVPTRFPVVIAAHDNFMICDLIDTDDDEPYRRTRASVAGISTEHVLSLIHTEDLCIHQHTCASIAHVQHSLQLCTRACDDLAAAAMSKEYVLRWPARCSCTIESNEARITKLNYLRWVAYHVDKQGSTAELKSAKCYQFHC